MAGARRLQKLAAVIMPAAKPKLTSEKEIQQLNILANSSPKNINEVQNSVSTFEWAKCPTARTEEHVRQRIELNK